MNNREKIVDAIEKAKKQSEEYAQDRIIVPFKETDMILALLKEQEAVEPILEQDSMVCGVCGHEVIWQKMLGDGIWADKKLDYCPHCGRKVKWE